MVSSSYGEGRWLPRSLRPGEARGTQSTLRGRRTADGAEEKAGHSGRDDSLVLRMAGEHSPERGRQKGSFFNWLASFRALGG